MTTIVELDGNTYKIEKLPLEKQLHLARKVGPIIAKIAPQIEAMQAAQKEAGLLSEQNAENPIDQLPYPAPVPGVSGLSDMVKLMEPVLNALSDMKDSDVDYIRNLCLSVTEREAGQNKWAAVWNARAGRMQFEDITFNTLIQIIINAVQENIGDFLGANPLATGAQGSPATLS